MYDHFCFLVEHTVYMQDFITIISLCCNVVVLAYYRVICVHSGAFRRHDVGVNLMNYSGFSNLACFSKCPANIVLVTVFGIFIELLQLKIYY